MKWIRSEAALLIALFCLSEVIWYARGIRFDHADAQNTPLHNYVQYVDAALLRDRPAETLFYLHVQPPLFHVFLYAVLLFPESWHVAVFSIAYSAMALALVLAGRALLADFGVPRVPRVIACAVLIFSPPLALLAKWLYVQMPVATLLVVAAHLLHRAVVRGRMRYYLGYGLCVAAIALITSYFHLVWVVAALLLPVVAMLGNGIGTNHPAREALKKGDRHLARAHNIGDDDTGSEPVTLFQRCRLLAAAWLPALLVVSVYMKNGIVFGTFVGSTWSSVAPSRTARAAVGPKVIAEGIAAGQLSPLMDPRNDIQKLEPSWDSIMELQGGREVKTGIAVLDQTHRASGRINWNNAALLPVYRRLAHDARQIALQHPGAWIRHAGESFCKYQAPGTWSDYAVGNNRKKILLYSELFEYLVWGQALGYALNLLLDGLGWVAFPTILAPVLLVHAVQTYRRPQRAAVAGHADRIAVAFLAGNLLYVAAVAIGVADAEHERYHFFSDALLFLLACRTAAAWLGRLKPETE